MDVPTRVGVKKPPEAKETGPRWEAEKHPKGCYAEEENMQVDILLQLLEKCEGVPLRGGKHTPPSHGVGESSLLPK